MSDTEAKVAKRRSEAAKLQKRNQRRDASKVNRVLLNKIGRIALTVVCIVLVVGFVLANVGITKRVVTAMRVGDERISSAEFSYYYTGTYQNYYQTMYYYVYYGLLSSVGIDTETSLRKQVYDEDTGETYADYFAEEAVSSIIELYALYQEAIKDGYTLTDAMQESIEADIEELMEEIEDYGYTSLKQYLKHAYGLGYTEKLYRKAQEIYQIAYQYASDTKESFEYSVDDLTKYYEDNKKDYDILTVRYYKIAVSSESEDTTEEKLAAAKAEAEEFMDGVETEEEYAAQALVWTKKVSSDPDSVTTESTKHEDTTYSTLSSANSALAEWACDESRVAGDTAVLDAGNDTGYYCVYMVEPSHLDVYNTVNVRHILIEVEDATGDTDEEQAASEEANDAAAKQEAEDLLNRWLENGATEDYFAELAADNSADSNADDGGLYEQIYKGQMVDEFEEWCFDESRQPGDTGIVKTDYGYHIMYFVGEDVPYWQIEVEDTVRTEDYEEFVEETQAAYKTTTSAFGIWFRNEPID